MPAQQNILQKSLEVIQASLVPEGILASVTHTDNYKRVWSRDAMMAGIAGLLLQDDKITEGLKNSILTLAKHQSTAGQIPSNVSLHNNTASYGTLSGRIDATTWWIIGTCLYLLHKNDGSLQNNLKPAIENALKILDAWEMNNRGLIYTPIGGNWADEYVTSGYTLYDNTLRLWALQLFYKTYQDERCKLKAEHLYYLIENNYVIDTISKTKKYHQKAYEKITSTHLPYLACSLSPNGYDLRWDMAANAFALLLGFTEKKTETERFLQQLAKKNKSWMLPVFYPVIKQSDEEWKFLQQNHLYAFKNKPHHFQNGGSWPVFLGWLAMGLNKNEHSVIVENIFQDANISLQNETPQCSFHEYWATDTFTPQGTVGLCFTASGFIFMHTAIHEPEVIRQKLFIN